MRSKATTVEQYLSELPEDRRQAISSVREVILKNLDKDYEEGMQYGMIGYYVPHRVYPPGYHCDPSQPLPFAGLASQKNYMGLYLMSIYSPERAKWFEEAWAKTGKKLDMGKCCVRFKKLEDLALDVIAEAIQRVPAKKYIECCEAAIQSLHTRPSKGPRRARRSTRPTRPARAGKSGRKRSRSAR